MTTRPAGQADPPAYERVKRYILQNVEQGIWREGDAVESENALAARFGLSRMTVNRALRELAAEHVIHRVQGAGSFVAATKHQSTLAAIKSIAQEVADRGHRYAARVLQVRSQTAPVVLAAELELPAKARVYSCRMVHLENDLPVQLEERWVNPACAPDFIEQDFAQTTPTDYLMRVAPLQRVEWRIEALAAPPQVAADLQMGPHEPTLRLHRRTWSQGQVATVALLWHPGSRFQFAGSF
jgi:GntR family histidine utilization transcriptional repressor